MDPRVKLRGGSEQGLCPDCLFLCRRQNQLEGPEKQILRILHEYLVRQGVADKKSFVPWNNMPSLAMPNPPRFWSESIFGFFLKRWYVVTYIAGGNRERVAAFAKDLHAVFAPDSDGNRSDFPFDSGHLSFHAGGIAEIKRPENNPFVRQFQVTVSFWPSSQRVFSGGEHPMRKTDRINPVFLVFFILLGFILLDLLVQGVGILLFDDTVPKEQTLNYQLKQMLLIVADRLRETGELPKDLDDVTFENEYLQDLYETDYRYGYIKWYIRDGKLVIKHSGNPAKNIGRKRKEMKLPPELLSTPSVPSQE